MSHPNAITSYIALGSNLQSPREQVTRALERLKQLPKSSLESHSRLYQTAPVGGPPGQPDYINAVAKITTQLGAHDLLDVLLRIEQEFGRVRLERDGPRTLDLDILLYGDEIINTPELIIPHPRLTQRAFVLEPLAEITPDCVLPDGRSIQSCVALMKRSVIKGSINVETSDP